MVQKSRLFCANLFISVLVMVSSLSPVIITPLQLGSNGLYPENWVNALPFSSNIMGAPGKIWKENGAVQIESPSGRWTSPSGWIIQQANWTDLNNDGRPEVTLLVKRPFAPWPVDRVLPYGGYIQSHQDSEGFSSHIILIGWKGDHWGELWAGSALARPVRSFFACDVDNDGRQELAVLEGSYEDKDILSAASIAIWKWNSFGFDLISRLEKPITRFIPVTTRDNKTLILTQ